jgi:hypothetical protein
MERTMSSSDDGFETIPDREAFEEELERHNDALDELVTEYMDKHDISMGAASFLLLTLAVKMRMAAYGLETEQPSVSGLKLDLDRFRREVEDVVREAKKSAEEFIREVKTKLAELENEEGGEP